MIEIADVTKMKVEKLQGLPTEWNNIRMDVLRADLVHPAVSGNKWFKLKYHIQTAVENGFKGLATFGGAYSNHIHATAYAARSMGLRSLIVVRGQRPDRLSPTLNDCETFGSTLLFTDHRQYREHEKSGIEWTKNYPEYFWISEGGRSPLGLQGIPEMLLPVDLPSYTHICCAVGTGTMMAGLSTELLKHQQLIGIPVLKLDERTDQTILPYVREHAKDKNIFMAYGYHEGGYARCPEALIDWMNSFSLRHGIPLDFVYTGKLFKAITQLAENGYFEKDSRLLLVHSGGLQGNRSLPPGLLAKPQ